MRNWKLVFIVAMLMAFSPSYAFASLQNPVRIPGPGGATSGASAPTFAQDQFCKAFNTPATCTFTAATTTGQKIFYAAVAGNIASVLTVTDNCNSGGSSDSYTTDEGPTNNSNSTGLTQSGHASIGLGTGAGTCVITVAYTGSAVVGVYVATMNGSSGFDIASAINNQALPGTGANAITSNAVTTTAKDLCFGWTVDASGNGGTLSAGTLIAWVIGGATDSTLPMGGESFAQSVAGSITATWTSTTNSVYSTSISCFKP